MPAAGKPGQVPSVLLSTQADVKCRREPVRSGIQSLLSWQERLEKHHSKKLLVHWMSAVTPGALLRGWLWQERAVRPLPSPLAAVSLKKGLMSSCKWG